MTSADRLLSHLTDWLRRRAPSRSIERSDDGWVDDHDLSVFGRPFGVARRRALAEDHGGGRRSLRVGTHLDRRRSRGCGRRFASGLLVAAYAGFTEPLPGARLRARHSRSCGRVWRTRNNGRSFAAHRQGRAGAEHEPVRSGPVGTPLILRHVCGRTACARAIFVVMISGVDRHVHVREAVPCAWSSAIPATSRARRFGVPEHARRNRHCGRTAISTSPTRTTTSSIAWIRRRG